MLLDEVGLDEYTDHFERDAFRHEVLTRYDVPSDDGEFARYLAGEPGPNPAVWEPWGRWVRQQINRGAAVRRVRVLATTPGAYLRFEAEWGYVANTAAGEDIRILDLTERDRPDDVIDTEFWMLDGECAVLMHYDDLGRFLHGETVEGNAAGRIRRARDAAWDAAEPFLDWWAGHPQFHRSSQARA